MRRPDLENGWLVAAIIVAGVLVIALIIWLVPPP
jgi:hypothetical protein